MCDFITMIAPTADADAVRAVMERHGRTAAPIENPSVRKALRENERQYLTTGGRCDCGTVLARGFDPWESLEKELIRAEARMRRQAWSEAKIARALQGRRGSAEKRAHDGPDSLELWNAILHDVRDRLSLPHVGLFVRSYSGSLVTETFAASRRELARNIDWQAALASMNLDEVTIFA